YSYEKRFAVQPTRKIKTWTVPPQRPPPAPSARRRAFSFPNWLAVVIGGRPRPPLENASIARRRSTAAISRSAASAGKSALEMRRSNSRNSNNNSSALKLTLWRRVRKLLNSKTTRKKTEQPGGAGASPAWRPVFLLTGFFLR